MGPRVTGAELKTQLENTSQARESYKCCTGALGNSMPKLNCVGLSDLDTQSVGTRDPKLLYQGNALLHPPVSGHHVHLQYLQQM